MKKNLLVALLSLSTLTVLTGCFGDKEKHVVREETTTVETTPATEDTAAEQTVTREVTVSEEAK